MNVDTFLLEDYKQKVTYLTNHLTRLWTRFNFFVTIESALVGGKFLIASNIPSRELAIAGIILSALWYVMGAQDRYLVKLYRWQVANAAGLIAKSLNAPTDSNTTTKDLFAESQKAALDYVGRVDRDFISRFELGENAIRKDNGPLPHFFERVSGWRSERFSTTKLGALYPLFAIGMWIVIFTISRPLT